MSLTTHPPTETTTDPRVPVTLLTGFLGAGKTTLLNRILNDPSSGHVAVIVNEFGEAGLDHELIETLDDDVILMQSGCLCCSIRGDLSKTIGSLFARRRKNELSFDRVVIETTGMADPGPILQTLLVDPLLARHTRLDGVVTVVDAANGPHTLDAQFEAVSQVAMADLIVISKTDLVEKTAVTALTERLRGLNPTAPINAQKDAPVGPQDLWDITGMRRDTTKQQALAWTTAAAPAAAAVDPLANLSGLSADVSVGPAFSPHDSRITSVSLVMEDPLKDDAFDLWLDTLIALKGPDILRVKGIIFLEDLEIPFVFHGVQHIFDPPVPLKSWTGEDRRSRIVIIGRDLDQTEMQRSFEMLQARKATPETATMETPT